VVLDRSVRGLFLQDLVIVVDGSEGGLFFEARVDVGPVEGGGGRLHGVWCWWETCWGGSGVVVTVERVKDGTAKGVVQAVGFAV